MRRNCNTLKFEMGLVRKTAGGRFVIIDALRGFAVILMIFFHLFYDLNIFQLIAIDLTEDPFWFTLPRVIVSVFLICVGMGLALVHKNGIRWEHVRKRIIKIGGCALLITGITFFLFPKQYIFFGILHCIALSSVMGLFFVKYPRGSLMGFIVIILSYVIFKPSTNPFLDWMGVRPLDFIPIYPWFGSVLLGIFLEFIRFHKIPVRQTPVVKCLEYLGRHSLVIYLIHQPVLFGMCYAISKMWSGT